MSFREFAQTMESPSAGSAGQDNLVASTQAILKPDFVLDHFAEVKQFASQLNMTVTPELLAFATKVAQAAQALTNHERDVQNHAFVEKVGQLISTTDAVMSESQGVAGFHLNGDVANWESFDLPEQLNALEATPEIQGYRGFCKANLLDENPSGTYADFTSGASVESSAQDDEDQSAFRP